MSEPISLKLDQLATGQEVMRACGWSPAMMSASRAAGYVYKYGTKTTLRHYLKWREANPDFRITPYVRAHSRQTNGAKGLSQRGHGRRAATAHTRD